MDLYPGSRPCVGCGFCCRKAPCILASSSQPPCSDLVEVDGRWRCGKVQDAHPEARSILLAELAIGAGCCSPLNSDRHRYRPRTP